MVVDALSNLPQRLKPGLLGFLGGTTEVVPCYKSVPMERDMLYRAVTRTEESFIVAV